MDERILKIHYSGNSVSLRIDDIDRCLLIDVINDMCEEFKKNQYELPTYPGLHYCYSGRSYNLVDDGTMMKMFERITGKEIDVWVGCLAKPSFIWNLAQTVRKTQNPNDGPPENDTTASIVHGPPNIVSGPQMTPPHVQTIDIPTNECGPQEPPKSVKHIIHVGPSNPPRHKLPVRKKTPTVQSSSPLSANPSRRLPRLLEEISPDSPPHVSLSAPSPPHVSLSTPHDNLVPSDSHLSPPPLRRSPRILQGLQSPNLRKAPDNPSTHDKTSQVPTESPSQSTKKTRVRSRQVIFPHGRKLPNSTARLKGVPIIPTQTSQHNVIEGESSRTRTRSRGISKVNEGGGRDAESTEGTANSSDGEYEPLSDEGEGGGNTEDEEEFNPENPMELLNQNCVDGNWEPFRRNEATYEDVGDYISRLYKNGEVYEDVDIGKITLKPWQLFVDRDHFKDTLRDFCIQEGFSLVVRRSEERRYTAECADIRCSWRIHASMLLNGCTWAIKSIKTGHACDLNMTNNPMCTCEWATKKLLEDIRCTPDIKGKALNSLLWERYGITMATSSLYKMKKLAMEMIQGSNDESYGHLTGYCEMVKERNQGSIAFCLWKAVQQPQKGLQFRAIFISFAAQFNGLINGCRGLVGVDGCHLKGGYGGVLLSAVSLDGNQEIFPIVVAVVDSENKSSWSWFFTHLKNILTQTGRSDWAIMSDRQKGIDPALDVVWPRVDRRYCARHLCKNFKAEYPGVVMHKLFWNVTNAYSAFSFKKALQQVQKATGLGAVKWFREIGDLDRWTKWKFDPNLCSDENTNNFVESFNNTIGVDRTYPILTLLEGVRRIAMVRHATRQQVSEQWLEGGVCPNIRERVRVLTKESRTCHAYPAGRGEYEISDKRSMLPVSLNSKSCVCGRWQITGIPCRHGIRAILDAGKDPLDFVSEWYSVSRYKAAYKGNILPIPDLEQWPSLDVPTLIPPTLKRSVGRPSRNRRREEGEQRKGKRSSTVQCGKCKEFGHNTLTCKGGLTKKERQEQQGVVKPKEPTHKPKKNTRHQRSADTSNMNLIELMISQPSVPKATAIVSASQPLPSTKSAAAVSASQPIPRTKTRQQSSQGQASTQPPPTTDHAASQPEEGYISPKRRKILNRLSML